MRIPKSVRVDLMYRDACNYKNCDSFTLINKMRLSNVKIANALRKLEGDNLIASYFKLPNIAVMDNEFLPSYTDDHSYSELVGWECEYDTHPLKTDPDIFYVVEAVNNPKLVDERRAAAKDEAFRILRTKLSELENE